MMAADNQEDLSMEDILSSIKNILMEDSIVQQQNQSLEDAEPVSADFEEISVVDDDDILELTPSSSSIAETMPKFVAPGIEPEVVSKPLFPEAPDAEEDVFELSKAMMIDDNTQNSDDPMIDIDNELANLSSEFFVGHDGLAIGDADEDSEPIFEQDSDVSFEDVMSPDLDSDPFYEEETTTGVEDSFISDSFEQEAPAEESTDSLIDFDMLNEIIKPQEPILEPQPILEPEPIYEPVIAPKPEPIPVVERSFEEDTPTLASEPVVAAVDSADVSANIISNFAKMFSREKTEQKEEEIKTAVELQIAVAPAPQKITNLGNGDLTIETIVREEVKKAILGNLDSSEISEMSKQEIAKQTKIWLDANLPMMVETIVKKEIERVMAKVSS